MYVLPASLWSLVQSGARGFWRPAASPGATRTSCEDSLHFSISWFNYCVSQAADGPVCQGVREKSVGSSSTGEASGVWFLSLNTSVICYPRVKLDLIFIVIASAKYMVNDYYIILIDMQSWTLESKCRMCPSDASRIRMFTSIYRYETDVGHMKFLIRPERQPYCTGVWINFQDNVGY